MEAPKEHFIEEAIRGLPNDAELAAAARHLLIETPSGHEEGFKHAVSTWQEKDRSRFKAIRKWLYYGLLAVISTIAVVDTVKMCWGSEQAISAMDGSLFIDVFHNAPHITEEQVATRLALGQRLLVFGDLSKTSIAERRKALWDSGPENASFYAEYAEAHLQEKGKLPEGFLETAKRLDPDNAWFTHVAAAVRAKGAVKSRKQSTAAKASNATLEWDVVDTVAMEDALSILRQARSQPRCENPRAALFREQMNLLPMETPTEVIFSLGYKFGKPWPSETALRSLGEVLAAKAWLAGETGDKEGFANINELSELFLRQRTEAPVGGLIGELITRVAAFATVSNRAHAAAKLGLTEEARWLDGPLREVERLKKRTNSRIPPHPNGELAGDHGGYLAGLFSTFTLKQIEDLPMLASAEVEPGRMMNHATLSWTGAWLAWAVLVGGTVVCALCRFAGRDVTKHLGRRMKLLMSPWDSMAVAIPGMVLPVLWFVAITRYTGLGGREFSMGRNELDLPLLPNGFLLGCAQFIALAGCIIFSCGWLACWRVGRKLGPVGMNTRPPWSMVVASLCSAAFIPASGWSAMSGSPVASAMAQGLIGTAVLSVVAFGLIWACGSPAEMIRNQAAMRTLVPVCAAATILPLASLPFFKAEAYRWSAKDELIKPSRNHMANTDFEHRMAIQMRKEVREILGYAP